MLEITSPVTAWKYLNGIVCVYKPAEMTMRFLKNAILGNLSRDLCRMEDRDMLPHVSITGDTTKELTVDVASSIADHPLVVGPRYQPSDFRFSYVSYLGVYTSGVCVLGINDYAKVANAFKDTFPLRTYHVKGRFGILTNTKHKDGRVIYVSRYEYIKRDTIDKLCAAMQGSHQKMMYQLCGTPLQSEAAYQLALKGIIRPADKNVPIIYKIKCIDFQLPDFTLEITCVNEDEKYLFGLIAEIGLKVRSTASCASIQCIRNSFFTLKHALLRKHWTLQSIIENMSECTDLMEQHNKDVDVVPKTLEGEDDISNIRIERVNTE